MERVAEQLLDPQDGKMSLGKPRRRCRDSVGASHMSDNRQMSVAMQRLVDFISMVTNSTLLRNNTVTLY
jgi:hypothetical protein